jgi:hypothetical protein
MVQFVQNSQLTLEIGHTATVFGATGQLGRYIVNRLGLSVLHELFFPVSYGSN